MKNKMQAVIVEDEFLARQRLKKLLLPYADQIEIVGEASNGKEGVTQIEDLRPDLIFLDIQMPILNGFELLMKLTYQPHIVFTTAFDEYAIKAFEQNSIDYLLKPIRAERLEITMAKISRLETVANPTVLDQKTISAFLKQLQPAETMRSLTVTLGDKITIVDLADVMYFQAEDKLTTIYTKGDKKHLISQSLSQLEKRLPENFMRLNRAHIINDACVLEIRKGFNGKLVFEMKDAHQTKITTGSSYTAAVKEYLKF